MENNYNQNDLFNLPVVQDLEELNKDVIFAVGVQVVLSYLTELEIEFLKGNKEVIERYGNISNEEKINSLITGIVKKENDNLIEYGKLLNEGKRFKNYS